MSDSDAAVVQTPRFDNYLANTAGAIQSVAHNQGTGNSVVEDLHNMADPLNMNHSPKGKNDFVSTNITTKNDQAYTAEQNQAHMDQVTSDYHNSLQNLDVTTSNEIQAALATGDPSKAAALLEQSKAGTGIYGIRQMDQKQRQLLSIMPGRAQLSPRYNFINSKAGG